MEDERRYKQFLARQFYKLVCREKWSGGELPSEAAPLRTPLRGIVLSYTETSRCKTREECEKKVQRVQKLSREQGKPDTELNFLVGGDGYIYEAMGWHHYLPDHVERIKGGEKLFGKSIEVAFIGKHVHEPTEPMQRGLGRIITMGLTEQLLIEDFAFFSRSDQGIELLETRNKAREKRRYIANIRRERKDPNYRKEKREKIWVDYEELEKAHQNKGEEFPSKKVVQ